MRVRLVPDVISVSCAVASMTAPQTPRTRRASNHSGEGLFLHADVIVTDAVCRPGFAGGCESGAGDPAACGGARGTLGVWLRVAGDAGGVVEDAWKG